MQKNYSKRPDGRYQWQKQINGKKYYLIKSTKKELEKEVKKLKTTLNKTNNETKEKNISFYDCIINWFNLYKKDKIESSKRYETVINKYFPTFTMPIKELTKNKLQEFLNNIQEHRNAAYAYYIITGTFQNEFENKTIKENIAQFLKKPINKSKPRENFTYEEQKAILDNLHKTNIAKEILFYVLIGCRPGEAKRCKLDIENSRIFVNGTKTRENSKRFVPISKKYLEMLKQDFSTMFKYTTKYYTDKFTEYLNLLEIKNKTLYSLRHTFSTNTYALGATDKQRQYFMGHASIKMTNDVYLHYDTSITKEKIYKLYNNLYPEFLT